MARPVHRRPTCRRLQRQRDGVVAASDTGKQIRIKRIGDVVDVAKRCIGLAQAIVDRVIRKLPDRERNRPLAVLHVREAFLFGGGQNLAITHDAGCAVVVGGVDAKGDHGDVVWSCI